MIFTPDDVRANSPKTLSLVELKSQRDLDIFRKIYSHSIRIGDNAPGWEISYAREFDMTNDSKYFPPLEKWEAKGYKPDVFGRWIGPDGDVALPLYQGGMIHNLDPFYNGWHQGRWVTIPALSKVAQSKFLMAETDYCKLSDTAQRWRIAYRRIARTTDTRTFIGTFLWPVPCGDSVFLLLLADLSLNKNLGMSAILASLTFDSVIRQRLSGTNLSWFVMEECPIPKMDTDDGRFNRLVLATARLTFLHRRFAPEWLRLKRLYPNLSQTGVSGLPAKEWKHWWAVTEADRLRLRVEIDALCADLYGLDPDDYDWIVRDDPSDPKGFYRVDRNLPFRERLTGLAAAAFRALKEDKWSAESASKMTNDQFFEIIGIPEMTSGPEPLIRKRDGCHRWEPVEFGKDDPRHGWTWDHCWQDAVALLGSEEAVREYVEGKNEKVGEEASSDGPKDLFGQPLPPVQQRLF